MCYLSIKEGCLSGLFCLSCWDLPNHGASCCTLGFIGKPLMSRGAPNWFHIFSTYSGVVIEYCRWWKKLHQFDQVSKNGFLLSCCGLFPLQYWVYYCSKLPVSDVESFRSCQNSKTWTRPNPWFTLVPSLSKCESGKFIGPWHFQQLHNYEKYDKFWYETGKYFFCKISIFSKYSILCVSF